MQYRNYTENATADRALIATLAACTTFVVGYTLTRVALQRPVAPDSAAEQMVIPHQATLWSDLAE